MDNNIKPWEMFGGGNAPAQENSEPVKPWEYFADQRKQQSGPTLRDRAAIRDSFVEDPLACVPEENRAAIEAILKSDPAGAEEKKKRIALSRYYSMNHPDAADFIFDNLEAAIEKFEGKPMSVEQAYNSIAQIYQPKPEKGFWENRAVAAVVEGEGEVAKATFNTAAFLAKLFVWGANENARAELMAQGLPEAAQMIPSGEKVGKDVENKIRGVYKKHYEPVREWAAENMDLPEDWVTNSDSLGDWLANAGIAIVNYTPQLAAQVGLAATGVGATGIGAVYGIGGYYDARDEYGMDEGKALVYGFGIGLINGVLEKITLGIVEGKVSEKVAKEGIKKGLLGFLKHYGFAAGKEGAEEALEEIAENILDIGMGVTDTTDFTEADYIKAIFKGVPEAAFLGAVTGGPLATDSYINLREVAERNEEARAKVTERIHELTEKGELTEDEEKELGALQVIEDSGDPMQARQAAIELGIMDDARAIEEEEAEAELTDEEREKRAAARMEHAAEEGRNSYLLRHEIKWNPQDTIDRVRDIMLQFPAFEYNAVWSADMLPDEVKQAQIANGINLDRVRAAIDSDNVIHIVADKVRPSEAAQVIGHEIIGHRGLRATFGDKFDSFLDRIYKERYEEIDKYAERYHTSTETEEGQRYLTEEYLADMANAEQKPVWWKEFIAQIRDFLRKVFPNIHFSDADIEHALMQSARAMRAQRKNPGAARFSISPVWTGSAADYGQPSLNYVGTGEGAQVYGWGLYGSTSRGVAEWYAETDVDRKGIGTLRKFNFDGVPISNNPDIDEKSFPNLSEEERSILRMAWNIIYGRRNRISRADLENELYQQLEDNLNFSKFLGEKVDREQTFSAAENVLSKIEITDIEETKPHNLYKQTFWPDKEENLLDWDENISEEQANQILDALAKEHDNPRLIDYVNAERGVDAAIDGEEFEKEFYYAPDVMRGYLEKYLDFYEAHGKYVYKQLADVFNSPKAASEFLYRAGIDGITYIGDSSREQNYVAFSDKDIRVDEHIKFALIGEDGATRAQMNLDNLNRAKEMEKAGFDNKTIWAATGWERGKDSYWRMEAPDVRLKTDELTAGGNYNALIDYDGPVDGYFSAPELFSAYPDLKQYRINVVPLPRGEAGYHDKKNKIIAINKTLLTDHSFDALNDMEADKRDAKTPEEAARIEANIKDLLADFEESINNVLIHEVQHAIQHMEGFSGGQNLVSVRSMTDYDDPAFLQAKTEYERKHDEFKALTEQIPSGYGLLWTIDDWLQRDVFKGNRDFYQHAADIFKKYVPENIDDRFHYFSAYLRLATDLHTLDARMKYLSSDFSRYRRSAGEVEARNVEMRNVMNPELRKERPPSETEDYSRDEQIVRFSVAETGEDVRFSIREEDPPKKTLKGYKVFAVKKKQPGELFPPMVANPGGESTPVGIWLNADAAPRAEDSKTGRKRVQAGGKGTNVGKQTLAYRPGWHLGEVPIANQFMKKNPETGEYDLFPDNFVWAECEIAADVDYQKEAMSYGYNKNGHFEHAKAGLPRIPKDGFYRYRTNPDPKTEAWMITGAMRVTRILDDADVEKILKDAGREPYKRQGGPIDLAAFGLEKGDVTKTRFSVSPVYTGSAADYDQPSLNYIGTGEGAQVFGWGLYGSESRSVAEWYATKDSQRKFVPRKKEVYYLDGEEIKWNTQFEGMRELLDSISRKGIKGTLRNLEHLKQYATERGDTEYGKKVDRWLDLMNRLEIKHDWKRVLQDIFQRLEEDTDIKTMLDEEFLKTAKKKVPDYVRKLTNDAVSSMDYWKGLPGEERHVEYYELEIAALNEVLENLPSLEDISELRDKKRNLYNQTFWPDKQEDLLDWDEPLSKEQIDKILAEMDRDSRFEKQDYEKTKKEVGYYTNVEPDTYEFSHYNEDDGTLAYKTLISRSYLERLAESNIIYDKLAELLDSPQEASEFLYRAGIDGVTYIGDSSGVRNYVAFSDKDIRVDEHIRFSVAGEDENLIAVHNVSEQKLRDAIKLGALPVPSLGIIDAEKSDFTDYGRITLVADTNLIDPTNRKNKVFGADAYSPRRPNVEKKYSDKEFDRALEVIAPHEQHEADSPLSIQHLVYLHRDDMVSSDFEDDLKHLDAVRAWYAETKDGDEIFEDWWQRVAAPELDLHPVERIFDGFTYSGKRRYLTANLETIVKLMTRKTADGEGFFYGLGNVRALVSKQFKSVAEIKKNRDKIVSGEDYKKIKQEYTEEFNDLLDRISSSIRGNNISHSIDTAGDLLRAMAEGTRNRENLEWLISALGHDNPIYQDMADFLMKLKNMPTPLFEAKPQRAVYLNEFKAAVVPEGTAKDILNALEEAGVDVFTYANDAARKATLQFVTQEKKLRFSLDSMSDEDKRDIVAILKPKYEGADFVEPSQVKFYLGTLGIQIDDENDAWSLYQMAGMEIKEEKQKIAAQKKKAKERARDQWILENYDMINKAQEFTGYGGLDIVIRPSMRFDDADEWPGTFIAKEWREKGKKRPRGNRESELRYSQYLRNRDIALSHADGKASDELAQEIANKYGGDPLDIEEALIETFRYLKKPDLYAAYKKHVEEEKFRDKQAEEEWKAEREATRQAEVEDTVVDLISRGEPITPEYAEANPDVFNELYRQFMEEEPPKSKKPSELNLETINAALQNEKGREEGYAAAYKDARAASWKEFSKRLGELRDEFLKGNAKTAQLQRDAIKFAEEHLPEELRGEFTRGIVRLLEYGTSPTKKYPEGKRLAMYHKLMDDILTASKKKRAETSIKNIREMLDAAKMKRNWKGIPVSIIPSEQAHVDRIRKIVDMNPATVANAVDYNNERIAALEMQLDSLSADEDRADIEAEIKQHTEDNALLEMFGNLPYLPVEQVKTAENMLKNLIKKGKIDLKTQLGARFAEAEKLRRQAIDDATFGKNYVPDNSDAKNHLTYMLKTSSLSNLMRIASGKSIQDFDDSYAGKLWNRIEDSTQTEQTSTRRLQNDFDAALEEYGGVTGNVLAKMRKKGKLLREMKTVTQKTGVFKTEYSRIVKVDEAAVTEGQRRKVVRDMVPVDDYEYMGQKMPGARSILRAIENGEPALIPTKLGGTRELLLDETGVFFLRKQLEDYDAGIKRTYEVFTDKGDQEAYNKLQEEEGTYKIMLLSHAANESAAKVEVPLSQGSALQILLTWEQEDFRPNMLWNGWTEESIEQIKKFLKPETKKLGEWMRDYIAKNRDALDAEVYNRYGAHLPKNPNYWPGVFRGSMANEPTSGPRGAGMMTINPSFLIARRFHLKPLDMDADAFTTFFNNQIGQAHFLAWSDTIRQLREVYGNQRVQKAINDNFGKDVTREIVEQIGTLARGGQMISSEWYNKYIFNELYRYWVPAKIAVNLSSIIKQGLGVLSYTNDVPIIPFVKNLSKANFANKDFREFVRWAKDSDYIKNRKAGGLDRDLIYMLSDAKDSKQYSPMMDAILAASTWGTKAADVWSALHGGYAVYQYAKEQAKQRGLNETEAERAARRAWMRATDETQQSGYLKDLNYFQQNQGLIRYLTAFRANPIQLMNLELRTLRELKYGEDKAAAKKKLARQLLVNHIVVPTMMQFVTDMLRYGLDVFDDAEIEDYFIAWLFGPFESGVLYFQLANKLVNIAADKIIRGKSSVKSTFNAVPLAEDIERDVSNLIELAGDDEITADEAMDGIKAAGDIGMAIGAWYAPAGPIGTAVSALATQGKRIWKLFNRDEENGGNK